MKLFNKKETLLQSMPFMALMAAINVIIAVISALSPGLALLFVILLPLTSTLVAIYCKSRYFPIYAFATFGLSIVATLWNMETTFFYVLPSIIVGFIFGVLTKLKIHPVWSIFVASIFQAGMTAGFIPLINLIFDTDMIDVFKTVLNLHSVAWGDIILLSLLFIFSLIQIILNYFVVSGELKKFGIEEKTEVDNFFIYPLITIVFCLGVIGFYFISLMIAYLFMCFALYFAAFDVYYLVKTGHLKLLIGFGISIVANVILFAVLNGYLKENSQILLVTLTPLCIGLISFVFSFLQKKKE